jgi:hypothetical protein
MNAQVKGNGGARRLLKAQTAAATAMVERPSESQRERPHESASGDRDLT